MKKIIPCLDVKDGRVVKGVKFEGLNDVSSPVKLAEYYNKSGADELVFYDITASSEGRKLFADVLTQVIEIISIPLTVGGGIYTIEDFDRIFKLGANKISINSGALKNPNIITEASAKYGKDKIVLSVDVKKVDKNYRVFAKGGREDTGLDAIEWIKQGVSFGAGELVVNSIDTDGVKKGFDLPLLEIVSNCVNVPIVASGGAGCINDFIELFTKIPNITAGLAASIFHYGDVKIMDLKKALQAKGIEVAI
jgi:cyclase